MVGDGGSVAIHGRLWVLQARRGVNRVVVRQAQVCLSYHRLAPLVVWTAVFLLDEGLGGVGEEGFAGIYVGRTSCIEHPDYADQALGGVEKGIGALFIPAHMALVI